ALDAGGMLDSVRVAIGPDETSEEVEKRLAVAGANLLVKTVDRMAHGPVGEIPQDEGRSTYAARLRKDEGLIDWTRPAADIHNQVRGLHPWPHAFTYGPSGRLIVHRSAPEAEPVQAAPGTILSADAARGLVVSTGLGRLRLLDVQAEGGRVQPASQFLPGHPLEVGTRLGPP